MATDSTLPTSPISSFGQLLSEHRISQRALARAAGMSTSAMHRLVRQGHWPARDAEATAQRITQWLVAQGVDAEGIRHALPSIDTPHSPEV